MALKWYFKNRILFLVAVMGVSGYSQNTHDDDLKHRIYYAARTFAFLTYSGGSSLTSDNMFDFNDDTKLTGVNLSVNYYLENGISLGLGTGKETFAQPRFSYLPLYLRIALNGGTIKNSITKTG